MPIIEDIPDWKPCSNLRCWFDLIVFGGLLSAAAFIAFQTIVSWIFSGDFLLPLRLLAIPFMTSESAVGGTQYVEVIAAGLAMLVSASILSAYLFMAVLTTFPKLTANMESMITSACVLGYVLWILDFYALAQAALPNGITRTLHPGLQGFIAHVFCFGMVLGAYVHRRQEKRKPSVLKVRFRF